MTFAMFVATLGGAGRLKPAPGTWGSLVVLPLVLLGPVACWVLAAVFAVAGYWAARHVLLDDTEDPGWFVTDEGAGMLIALAALPAATPLGVLLAFLLFRLLDITKPWPISWADAQPAPAGVMADDLIAGGLAALALFLIHSAWPEVLT